MKKVLSFSLWGDNPTYNIGAIKNVELAKQYYPDFECWFYIHSPTVPVNTIKILEKFENVKIILKNDDLNTCKPMCWRFESIDDPDVEIMMSRDTDTRILSREKMAVDEWLESGKLFHIMRDHPDHHYYILGGLFGMKKHSNISNMSNMSNLINNLIQNGPRDYDQDFLKNIIYPIIKDDCLIHASFNFFSDEITKPFPIPYDSEYRFVGEYVYSDESRSQNHINELKKRL